MNPALKASDTRAAIVTVAQVLQEQVRVGPVTAMKLAGSFPGSPSVWLLKEGVPTLQALNYWNESPQPDVRDFDHKLPGFQAYQVAIGFPCTEIGFT